MTVEPILPDQPATPDPLTNAGEFARALDALGQTLTTASGAEDAFAYGRGTLENAVYERARADVALAVASSSASRIAQAVQTILNMQV